MKDRLSFSDRTSFSRVSQRLSTTCMSDGITGVELLSFASAILNHKNVISIVIIGLQQFYCFNSCYTNCNIVD